MLILALDTTTREGSAAVVGDGRVLAELSGDASLTHGQRLPADVGRVLEAAGVALRDVELFAVAVGPGSFTGLRVGIATIQGLATATGHPVVPVSALDALARTVDPAEPETRIASWMDAQRGEVFAALYDARHAELAAPSSASAEETLSAWGTSIAGVPLTFVGDGALRYADTIRARRAAARIVRPTPRLAGSIGKLAWERRDQAVAPHAVVPIYIRRPDAELARARRSRAGRP